MKKKRNQYTKEFKEAAVKLITEQGYQITEAARNLGVNANLLGRWKREMLMGQNGSSSSGNTSSLQSEEKLLRKCLLLLDHVTLFWFR
ncbi:MAG: transposase [Deltaproteobacteria bacterium]|nr:transposase [Candidatus Tharpellaceae bacterium]